MVLIGMRSKNWQSHLAYIRYYDRFLWLDLLPKIYGKHVSFIRRNLLQERQGFKELLDHRMSGRLNASEIDKLFYYFPRWTRLKAKLIAKTPLCIIKISYKFFTNLKHVFISAVKTSKMISSTVSKKFKHYKVAIGR